MILQQTVSKEIQFSGQAIQNGKEVTMTVYPQPAGSGIIFSRSDLAGKPRVRAKAENVVSTKKSVTLGRDGWKIATIEHLMAVFHGLGIDNALVEVDGDELPSGDGSALVFAEQILEAGITTQELPRKMIHIKEPLWVEGTVFSGELPLNAMLLALPSDHLEVSFVFTSDHPVTGNQFYNFKFSTERFLKEIAPARTIAFMREVEYLRSQGLARNTDLNIAVLVGDEGYENELRFPEEIVRHKILDILGDLYLAGPIVAHLVAFRSGHTLDLEMAKKITQLQNKQEG
ncbi:MAG: UDP-3-O-[3-hydroxymyristoyl] N-acetylglucosamine deacetylase [Firmicutes bacterium]|nr:UDP-3-O-[3-hydroxymyristoyl] N-acetylglucosamine deacetylase [Bacillota bacterium]